ncbi:MAG: hypothetical protein AVDCRST_MAG68-2161, partial [uncultured Gemmatimonadetes bacterium]
APPPLRRALRRPRRRSRPARRAGGAGARDRYGRRDGCGRPGGAAGPGGTPRRQRRHGQRGRLPRDGAWRGQLSPAGGADRVPQRPLGALFARCRGAARHLAVHHAARGDAGGGVRGRAPALRGDAHQRRSARARVGGGTQGARAHRAHRSGLGHRVRLRYLHPHDADAQRFDPGRHYERGAHDRRHPVHQRARGRAGPARLRAGHGGQGHLFRPRRGGPPVAAVPLGALLLPAPGERRRCGADRPRVRAGSHAAAAGREGRALAGRQKLGAAPPGVGVHARADAGQVRPPRPCRIRAPPRWRLADPRVVAAPSRRVGAGAGAPRPVHPALRPRGGHARGGRLGGSGVGGEAGRGPL